MSRQRIRHSGFIVAAILVMAMLVTACQPGGQGSQIIPVPLTGATATELVATEAVQEPTVAPAATEPIPTAAQAAAASTAPPEPAVDQAKSDQISVMVFDQSVDGGGVVIEQVFSDGPGWLVIHADNGGSPGAVLGYAPVVDGKNENVTVTIDDSEATPQLFAMLHVDGGEAGVYEFPGADAPAMLNGQMVSPSFQVTGGGGEDGSNSGSGSGNSGSGDSDDYDDYDD